MEHGDIPEDWRAPLTPISPDVKRMLRDNDLVMVTQARMDAAEKMADILEVTPLVCHGEHRNTCVSCGKNGDAEHFDGCIVPELLTALDAYRNASSDE